MITLMFYHVICIVLPLASSSAELLEGSWTQEALSQYYHFCGASQMCNTTTIQLNITDSFNSICPKCDCTIECRRRKNCCPEISLMFPNRTCQKTEILSKTTGSLKASNLYKMVSNCSDTSPEKLSKKCISSRNVTSQMTTLPVTSVSTLVTYSNIHCLQCHEKNSSAQTWKLDISCMFDTDFNFLNSLDEIYDVAKHRNCSIFSVPDSFAERCDMTTTVHIRRCNQTGTLMHMHEAIERACLLIDQPYGIFKNLFCYMCNPPVGQMDLIKSCPYDDTNLSRLCRQYPVDQITYPYKNYYCYICNMGNKTTAMDIVYDVNITGNGFNYHIFTEHCEPGLKLGEDAKNETLKGLMFYRPWAYFFNCPDLNIFSLFYNIKQLKDEAIAIGCDIRSSDTNKTLKCFKEHDLIRQCNVTGQMSFISPHVETACRSIENDNLIAYKGYYNIFCYMCNENVNTQSICKNMEFLFLLNMDVGLQKCESVSDYDLSIEWVLCNICYRPGYGSSFGYRQLFMLLSYKDTLPSTQNYISCTDNQMYDTSLHRCRDLYCGPGKMLTNKTCQPIIKVTSRLSYIFAASFDAYLTEPSTNQSWTNPMDNLYNELWNHLEINVHAVLHILRAYIITNVTCNNMKQNSFSGMLNIKLFIEHEVERFVVEERLLKILRSSLKITIGDIGIDIRLNMADEALKTPFVIDNHVFSNKCYMKRIIAFSPNIENIKSPIVNQLLLCQQVELDKSEFTREPYQSIKIKANGVMVGPNDYLLIGESKIRICVEKYKDALSRPSKKTSIDSSIYILSTICTTVSFICLILTFFTYSVFKVLRTVPGKNNMTLVISLLFNSICILVRFQDITDDAICQLFGVISHYFLLAVFTSFNICTFHLYRVFTNALSLTKSRLPCLKYNIYAFGMPALLVTTNIIVTYIMEDHQSIGYGGEYCFLIFKNAAITTLLCPVGVILIANTFMFVAAAKHIYMSPHVSSENAIQDRRRDVVIYLKLFTITGCTWIFQFIDAFFPESIFTVFISLCNMLTGVYIFTSYIFNKRVLMLYNNLFLRYSNIEDSKRHTRSDAYSCKGTSSSLYANQHSHLQTEADSKFIRDTRL